MNTGGYEYLLRRYLTEPPAVHISNVSTPVPDGTPWDAPTSMVLSYSGVMVDLGRVCQFRALEVSLDNNDDYRLGYFRDGQEVGQQDSPAEIHKQGGIRLRKITVPSSVATGGVDHIWVKPTNGDGKYSVGHLRLMEVGPTTRPGVISSPGSAGAPA